MAQDLVTFLCRRYPHKIAEYVERNEQEYLLKEGAAHPDYTDDNPIQGPPGFNDAPSD